MKLKLICLILSLAIFFFFAQKPFHRSVAHRSPSGSEFLVVNVAGVQVETEAKWPFPVARPEHLSQVSRGEISIHDLIKKGHENWYEATPFADRPFALPKELVEPRTLLPLPLKLFGDFGLQVAEYSYPVPIRMDHGAMVGLSTFTNERGHKLATVNCANCHTGLVNGVLVSGIGNKFFDEGKTFELAEYVLKSGLKSRDPKTRQESEYYMKKFSEYRDLIFTGCNKHARLGTHTGTRIEQVGSGFLHSLEQLKEPGSEKKYPCGGMVKVQPLNTLKFKNLAFSDGKMNSTWNTHWPIFTLLDKTDTVVKELAERPDIQALDAYAYFGTRSPSWKEIMKTEIDQKKAKRGYELFHAPNSCVSCHGSYSPSGMLTHYKVQITPLEILGTSPDRTVENVKQSTEGFYKTGPGPKFFEPTHEPLGYVANPLCSTFLNYPYLHTAGVASLYELLLPESERSGSYYVGDFVDKKNVGFTTKIDRKILELGVAKILVKQKISKSDRQGHSGERFGTNLKPDDKWDLIEYVKTLRCPEGP